jgi:hypothetical protein
MDDSRTVAEPQEKTMRRGSLAAFFAASPLPDSGLTVTRAPDGARDTALHPPTATSIR